MIYIYINSIAKVNVCTIPSKCACPSVLSSWLLSLAKWQSQRLERHCLRFSCLDIILFAGLTGA